MDVRPQPATGARRRPAAGAGRARRAEQIAVAGGGCGLEGVAASLPQHLAADDVADPGHDPLVEQDLAQRPVDQPRAAQILGGVEPPMQQIGPDRRRGPGGRPHGEPPRAGDDDVGRSGAQHRYSAPGPRTGEPDSAVHAQVDVQRAAAIAVQQQVLSRASTAVTTEPLSGPASTGRPTIGPAGARRTPTSAPQACLDGL